MNNKTTLGQFKLSQEYSRNAFWLCVVKPKPKYSEQRYTSQGANENSKSTHVNGLKRGKTRVTKLWLVSDTKLNSMISKHLSWANNFPWHEDIWRMYFALSRSLRVGCRSLAIPEKGNKTSDIGPSQNQTTVKDKLMWWLGPKINKLAKKHDKLTTNTNQTEIKTTTTKRNKNKQTQARRDTDKATKLFKSCLFLVSIVFCINSFFFLACSYNGCQTIIFTFSFPFSW